jgi:hypothetical protein
MRRRQTLPTANILNFYLRSNFYVIFYFESVRAITNLLQYYRKEFTKEFNGKKAKAAFISDLKKKVIILSVGLFLPAMI